MKKRINLFALLCALGLAFVLAGCGAKTEAPTNPTQAPVTTTVAPKTTTEAPGTSTKAPGTTTKAPTEAPGTTTAIHEHSWGEGVVTIDPTCTEKGVKTYTCSCGETKTEEIAALGHNMTHHEAVDATCTEAGNVEYWSCGRCNKNFSDESGTTQVSDVTTAALGHKAPETKTLYSSGNYHFEVCERCGFKIDFEDQTAGNFTDASWTQLKYTDKWETMSGQMRVREKDGSKVVNMSADYSMTYQYVLNYEGTKPVASGNVLSIDLGNYFDGAQVLPIKLSVVTKNESGQNETIYLLGDQSTFFDMPVTTGMVTMTVLLDKTIDVYELRITNKKSGNGNFFLYMDNIVVGTAMNKEEHTPVTDAAKAPTCTETGLTEGSHCSVCNAAITAQKVVPALGHDYQWIVDTAATASSFGSKHEECTRCHDKRNENTVIEWEGIQELDLTGYKKVVDFGQPSYAGYVRRTDSEIVFAFVGEKYALNSVAAHGLWTFVSVKTPGDSRFTDVNSYGFQIMGYTKTNFAIENPGGNTDKSTIGLARYLSGEKEAMVLSIPYAFLGITKDEVLGFSFATEIVTGSFSYGFPYEDDYKNVDNPSTYLRIDKSSNLFNSSENLTPGESLINGATYVVSYANPNIDAYVKRNQTKLTFVFATPKENYSIFTEQENIDRGFGLQIALNTQQNVANKDYKIAISTRDEFGLLNARVWDNINNTCKDYDINTPNNPFKVYLYEDVNGQTLIGLDINYTFFSETFNIDTVFGFTLARELGAEGISNVYGFDFKSGPRTSFVNFDVPSSYLRMDRNSLFLADTNANSFNAENQLVSNYSSLNASVYISRDDNRLIYRIVGDIFPEEDTGNIFLGLSCGAVTGHKDDGYGRYNIQIVKDGGFDVFHYNEHGNNGAFVDNGLKDHVSIMWARDLSTGKTEMIVVVNNSFGGYTKDDIIGVCLGMTGSTWGFDYYVNGENTGYCNFDDTSTYVRISSSNEVFRNATNTPK